MLLPLSPSIHLSVFLSHDGGENSPENDPLPTPKFLEFVLHSSLWTSQKWGGGLFCFFKME